MHLTKKKSGYKLKKKRRERMDKTKMGRGRKKTVGAGSSEAVALPIPGSTEFTHVYGDPGPPNSNHNSNDPTNPSSCPTSSVQTSSVQNPEVTDEDGEVSGDDDVENEEEATVAAASEPTKLEEGFFEIEAIRRKRVRKGQLQYLVKWHGWPETANTWEPLKNLRSCSDFVDTFEESLRIGKQQKRNRKLGALHTQPRKRKQHGTLSTHNITDVDISIVDNCLPFAPLNNKIPSNLPIPQLSIVSACEGEFYSYPNHTKTTGRVYVENGFINRKIDGRRKKDEYDPKLSELKTAVSANIVNSDKPAVNFQVAEASKGVDRVYDLSNVDCVVDSSQGNHWCIGAKRRKSNAVKRFMKEVALSEDSEQGLKQNVATVSIEPVDRNEKSGLKNPILCGHSRNVSRITRIIKPIGYSVSVLNNIQDVLVTFLVVRSDGKEVTVNNKFLKANNPLLLINFYEQHLRYNPTL